MNNNHQVAIEEVVVVESAEEIFELSLSELDLIGGGGFIVAMA